MVKVTQEAYRRAFTLDIDADRILTVLSEFHNRKIRSLSLFLASTTLKKISNIA